MRKIKNFSGGVNGKQGRYGKVVFRLIVFLFLFFREGGMVPESMCK